MPPIPKVNQGAVIIVDIGRNVSTPDEKHEKSFFENAIECTTRIIERKIISQGKDLIGVMLLGSKKTNNELSEQTDGAFKHIDFTIQLQPPTWQMIRDLPQQPSNSKGDWIDALMVAADHFKNGVSGVNISNKKIILMTNFKALTTYEPAEIEKILHGFKDEQLEVDVIGADIYDDNVKSSDFDVARQFVTDTNGTTATFNFAMEYFSFHRKRIVNAMPWNVDLSIGPNIKVPVTVYKRLEDESVLNGWKKAVRDPVTNKASTRDAVMKDKTYVNTENQAVVDKSEVIKGHHYGQRIIPYSDFDKSKLYTSGEKSLSVYGFTDIGNIHWQSLSGEQLYYLFGRKDDKKSQTTIRCLVECLHELNLAGIVRKVHNRNNAPKMFALMPVIDSNNFVCLSMAELCYKDDIKFMSFPSVQSKKYSCNNEQVNAFKDLIKAMDLTEAYDDTYDDTEALPVAETVSPFYQYILDCIAFRAMNPGRPIPQPRDEIMSLFKIPPLLEKRAKEPLEKLKHLFSLNKVEKKEKKKAVLMDDEPSVSSSDLISDTKIDIGMPKIQLPLKPEVQKIGTIDPINDYEKLKSAGKPLYQLSAEMSHIIESLIHCNLDGNYSKGFDVMTHFRKECVDIDPSPYNDWLQSFKTSLATQNKNDVLNLITEKKVNFILKQENSLSTYDTGDSHNESQLYENETQPNCTELTIQTDINDMFDDM